MLRAVLIRLWNNLGTMLLAFGIAFAVWISAVVAADPNEERDFPRSLPLEVRSQDSGLVLVGNLPTQVSLRLSAPVSIWDRLTSQLNAVEVYIDLSNLGPGEYTVPIEIDSQLRPLRVIQITPAEVAIQLETLAVEELPILTQIDGVPSLGFELGDLSVEPETTTVSGPQTLVAEVDRVVASLDVEDARDPVSSIVTLQALDVAGNVLSGLTLEPAQASVEQNIIQAGGYREVAVKVETVGQPANGFRVTSIVVDPPVVTLFSTDSEIVAGLPGFVQTEPLNISGVQEDLVSRLALALPQGVIVVGDQQSVEVKVGILAIETSTLLNVPVEYVGLATGLSAELSPQTVSVILSGPLSTLQSLQASDISLRVDLSGKEAGTFLLEPEVEILLNDVTSVSISPSQIEVVISPAS